MRFFVLVVAFCCMSVASSHEVRPAFLKITEYSEGQDAGVFEASFRQPQIDGRFLGLTLSTNCPSTALDASASDGALIEVFELDCSSEGLRQIGIIGLERTLIDTLVSINWQDGSTTNQLITAQAGFINLEADLPALPIYLTIGIKHLLLGYDHILFVLMLLYLVRKPIDIFIVVSSFTLAHSITLAISALDILTVSSAPVEAVIAASIVLLAYENLQTQKSMNHRFPVVVAFLFGLLHGLGFAGALSEIGLPEANQLMALLNFNIGIELGQLLVVVIVLGLVSLYQLKFKISRVVYEAPLYVCGVVASFWFIQRAWLIMTPVFS